MKKEYYLAALIACTVLLLANAYFFIGILQPKEGLSFLGRRVINSQDTYTYVSFIEQARQGRVLFENLYSTEPQTSTLIRPSYTFLGHAARITGVTSISAYHLGRIFFSVFFFITLYVFIGLFMKTPKRRLLAFTIVLTSTGLGYLLTGFWPNISDSWIPESITFLSLQEAPHFVLSQTLMLLSFIFLLRAWTGHKRLLSYTICLFSLILLGFEHPYNLFICLSTTILAAGYLGFKKKIAVKELGIGVGVMLTGCVGGNLYQFIETLRNPTLGSWVSQSNSPDPINYVLGYGILIIFALFGLERYLHERKMPQMLLVCWIISTSILLYSPVFFQRRLSEGLHIPLAILATEGVILSAIFLSRFAVSRARMYVSYAVIIIAVIFMTVGTIGGVFNDMRTINSDSLNSYYYYMSKGEIKGMLWLSQNTDSKDTVLANWFYGNVLPGVSGRKVYIGHKAQTKDFDEKIKKINQFILEKNSARAYEFLNKNKITYVYLGAHDSMVEYGFKPDAKPYLIKVYDESGVRVYKVK